MSDDPQIPDYPTEAELAERCIRQRRNPAPPTVEYYKRNAAASAAAHVFDAAYWSLIEAFNHLENAAYAEAEKADQLSGWKESALSLLNEWHAIGEQVGGKLGSSHVANVRAELARLKASNAELRATLEVALTALLFHIGGSLSHASAHAAIKQARAALAKTE